MFFKLMVWMCIYWGLIVVLVVVFGVYFFLKCIVWGFEICVVGENVVVVCYVGILVIVIFVCVGLFLGVFVGFVGVGEVVGLKGYLMVDLLLGFGYFGIVVVMLVGFFFIGVVFVVLFIVSIFVGVDFMFWVIGVFNYFVDLIVVMVFLCVFVFGFFLRFKICFVGVFYVKEVGK